LIGDERGCDIADQLVESDDLGHMGILYVSGEAARRHPTVRVGHACLAKPYTLVTLNEALEIVRDIACEGATSRLLPRGLRLLSPAETLPQPAA
jgi:hypothetical protein